MSIFDKALEVATKAHAGQTSKYTGEPYVLHPGRVALHVRRILEADKEVDSLVDMVAAAAVMHDVLEDTDYSVDEMRHTFGDFITGLVLQMTDVSKKSDGNRAVRKEIDRRHLV